MRDALHENHQQLAGVWAHKDTDASLRNRGGIAEDHIVNGAKGAMERLLWMDKKTQRRVKRLIREDVELRYTEFS